MAGQEEQEPEERAVTQEQEEATEKQQMGGDRGTPDAGAGSFERHTSSGTPRTPTEARETTRGLADGYNRWWHR